MFRGVYFAFFAAMGVCLSGQALTGSGVSAPGALETVSPVFSDLSVLPGKASAGQAVTLAFMASEPLVDDPVVLINGNETSPVSDKADGYLFAYTVSESDAVGAAVVRVSGMDLVGNAGNLSSDAVLEIMEEAPRLPVRAWPVLAVFLPAGIAAFARRRGATAVMLALALLLTSAVFADMPVVEHVSFTQGPSETGGTQVEITYDLTAAPNGPCDITVWLSKDGGIDGYPYPAPSITGDVVDVNLGTGKHIVWEIRADYAEEDIPNARIRVTADDGVVQHTLSYTAGANGSIAGISPQTVNHGANGTQVTAVPDDGYTFSHWSDGVLTAVRTDTNVTADINVTASFVLIRTILLPGDVPLELVWIPSGSFQMGRYAGEADGYPNEDSQHPVSLSYGFWMGKCEVTQQQWLAVQDSWPGAAPWSTYGLGNTYPAYSISWNDAKDFTTTLNVYILSSGQGPLTVRLPSEAEWEYACRAGTATRFYWGNDSGYTQIGMYAWYLDNNSPWGNKPVGGKLPNGFGLYDMSGNVWEWCEDDYRGSYTGAPADGSAWIHSPRGTYRILRSGSWGTRARDCRSAYRNGNTPDSRTFAVGFRLAAVE